MRLLIVSRTPWNATNSFGNTFSNLFQGMEGVEIYNLCCQGGSTANDVVKETFQLTDREAMTGKHVAEHAPCVVADADLRSNRRRTVANYLARDILWALGRWKSPELDAFLLRVAPDAIYLPVYASPYMGRVQRYVLKRCPKPYAVHISDELYAWPVKPLLHPLKTLYQALTRRSVAGLIRGAKYGEAFARGMAQEYCQRFATPFFVIGKGVHSSQIEALQSHYQKHTPATIVFTGNVSRSRAAQIEALAREICHQQLPAVVKVYTPSPQEVFSETALGLASLQILPPVSASEVRDIQRQADFLLHVEGFDPQSVRDTRYSFSTKIIDYLLTGIPVIAIGPAEVCSMQTLLDHHLALTATSLVELPELVSHIRVFAPEEAEHLAANARQYLSSHRDIAAIQRAMRHRLASLTQ